MKRSFGKAAIVMAILLVFTGLLVGCSEKDDLVFTAVEQLNDSKYTVGVSQGGSGQNDVPKALPNVNIKYYTKDADAYLAIQQGKLDGFAYDRVVMEFAIARGLTGVKLLPENIGSVTDIAIGISPKSSVPNLQEKLNQFIAELKSDGTLDDMYKRWINDASTTMPDIPEPENPTLTIKIGTTGLLQPFSYYVGDQLYGYDIELIQRFALWMNAKVEISTYDYDGIVPAAESGSIDCIMANLNVTEERKQSILFSDTIFGSYNVMMVKDDEADVDSNRVAVETARVGVMDGSTNEIYAEEHYPNADRQNFKNYVDSTAALSAGKLDYAMMDYTNALRFTRSNPDLEIASEFLTDEKLCIGVSQSNPELYTKVNEVMDRFLTDGTVDAAVDHWIKPDGSDYDVVETPKLPDAPKIKVAIVSSREPTSFIMNGQFAGLDIEIIDRILYELGYQPEYMDMEWGAVMIAVGSGKVDMTLGMYNTPERAEKLFFTESYFTNPQLLVARKNEDSKAVEAAGGYTSLSQIAGKKIAIITGSIFDKVVAPSVPNAIYSYYPGTSDMITALKNGKVDGFPIDEPMARMHIAKNSDLTIISDEIVKSGIGMALKKGSPLTAEINREIARLKQEGVLDELSDKWMGADDSVKTLPNLKLTGENGTLKVACTTIVEPMCYVGEGSKPIGYDVELLMYIAQALGKRVELTSVDFSGLSSMIESGKADVAIGCLTISEERKSLMDMTDSYHDGSIVMVVRKADNVAATDGNFFDGLKQSFTRTFVTESRWKLVLSGLMITVVLSVCSGILGSVFGFGICMLRRRKRRLASVPAAIFIRIIQGTPIVVLLMILYYIIFGQMDISAIIVAILGFAVNFGVYVSEMIRTGIDAVDKGQIEAAHALGFTRTRTFWRITFPQAARHFLPVFKGEFISMVKMTSVVGYIAIQDLTKVSDIIRSRTLEAFFPLIATAILYFIVANLLTMLLSHLEVRLDPKRGKRTLKGVVIKQH